MEVFLGLKRLQYSLKAKAKEYSSKLAQESFSPHRQGCGISSYRASYGSF
jgi:hypothetical protein